LAIKGTLELDDVDKGDEDDEDEEEEAVDELEVAEDEFGSIRFGRCRLVSVLTGAAEGTVARHVVWPIGCN
jgi:hypothetical protein